MRIKRYVPTPFQTVPKEESVKTFKQRYDAKIETMWSRAMRRMNSDGKNNGGGGAQEVCNDDNDDECPLEKAILEISVTDTGIGIPTDRLPQLFKSFSQIDISTARRYGGTGLGLAISSTLVNHMGGGLWVESEEQLGSCFALTLPLSIAPPNDTMDDNVGAESASTNSVLTSPPSPVSTFSDGNISVGSAADHTAAGSPSHSSQQQQQSITSPPLSYQPSPFPGTQVQASSSDTNEPDSSEYIPKFSHDDDKDSMSPPTTTTTTTTTSTTTTTTTTTSTTPSSPATNISKSPMEFQPRHPRPHTKQRYHHHKKTASNDENIAMMYPIKIMLAEDNVCKYDESLVGEMMIHANQCIHIVNQKIAISILKRLGYHDVVVANNGREVLELMREIKFDVIFVSGYHHLSQPAQSTKKRCRWICICLKWMDWKPPEPLYPNEN